MNARKISLAVASVWALGCSVPASAITIDGISFSAGSIFELGEVFEAERLAGCVPGATQNCNGFLDTVGEELIGVGRITSIRAADNSLLWDVGSAVLNPLNRELALYFYDFRVQLIPAVVVDPITGAGTQQILFSGGKVELYSQANGTFSPGASQAAGIASVVGGTPWLTLAGAPIVGLGAPTVTAPITLISRAENVDPFNPLTSGNVFGQGRLDVTGGPAGPYLDTNTFGCLTGQGAPNCPYASDKSFSSEGGLQPVGASEWVFSGNLTVRDFAIPEPGIIGLLGIGLLGLGALTRRKTS